MPELELVQKVAPSVAAPRREAREAAREALLARIGSAAHPHRRWSRAAIPSGGIAAVAAAIALVALPALQGDEAASAASIALRRAAAVATSQPAPPALRRGEFAYTRSVNAYLSTIVAGQEAPPFATLVPHTRETWLAPDGTGWLVQSSGKPTFLSARDRQRWIGAGRPAVGRDDMDVRLANSDGPNVPMVSLSLPSDPDALFDRLDGEAEGEHEQMFTLIGDALRETSTTPAQRAALYEVAARLRGVELVGPVRDRSGRRGVAVAMRDEENRIRHTLIFDPDNSALLGEEQTALAGNAWGYRPGTVIGWSTYLETAVVDHIKQRP